MADVILAGATGLTGSLLLPILIARGHRVTTIARRTIADFPDDAHQITAPPDQWGSAIAGAHFDVGISCLGTTIKKAGSQAAFREIDYALLRDFAAATLDSGAQHFITISSAMAHSEARSFYLKTKGEAEDALRNMDFARLDIMQPGLLKGPRREFRLGEHIGILLSPLFDNLLHGNLRKFRSINADVVASAMAALVGKAGVNRGSFVHQNDDMKQMATHEKT